MDQSISIDHVTFRYGRQTIVSDLDLRVHPGDIYGFVGPNGAGKTTTIKMLLGLLTPHRGTIQVLGMNLRDRREAVLARVGSLVETPSLYPHLSARENLRLQQIPHGAPRSAIDSALDLVGLRQTGSKPVKAFSLGMKQRLGIALALLHGPDLLILDEPINGLDPTGILEFRLLLKRLAGDENVTVFLSSHILSELEQVVNRVGIISRGSLRYEGSLDDLKVRSAGRLILGVDDAERALSLIREYGRSTVSIDGGRLALETRTPSDAAQVNALLVRGGVAVSHLSLEPPNLEKLFLELVEAKEGDRT